MDDLSIQDYNSLITFYKNKNADLELQYLLLQINSKKETHNMLEQQKKELNEKFTKELSEISTKNVDLQKMIIRQEKQIDKTVKKK